MLNTQKNQATRRNPLTVSTNTAEQMMITMVDKQMRAMLIGAGILCLVSVIMSLYSISTAYWSTLGPYHIGLFQTCAGSVCVKNQYTHINNATDSPPIFSKRFFNAAPLAIVGVFIQLISCFLCFFTAFIYLPPKPSITCFITPSILFIAVLFQLITLAEAAHGIYLNDNSSVVFETALILLVGSTLLTTVAADRLHKFIRV